MKRIAFYTLGCKLNFAETSFIGKIFQENSFTRVDFEDNPNIFVINTCSVTENADKKCAKIVNEALSISPNAFIIVIGCYAQLKPEEVAKIPGVDAVVGTSEKFELLKIIKSFEKTQKTNIHVKDINEANRFSPSYSMNDRTRTFLKVQDGCNYHCSFCTIPLARGKSRSATIEEIVAQALEISKKGIKEIVLTGVNIGDYGIIDGKRKTNFLELIKELDDIDGIERFRISSIEPNLANDSIINFVATSNKFVPHFHLPLQSGSDKILKLMFRRYQTELYMDRVNTIKSNMPHCCIGVDVITGFPGETEDDFLETYRFLNTLPISYLHVFPYSERDNTNAITLKNVIPQEERNRRAKMLRILSEKKLTSFYRDNLGKVGKVLFEKNESEQFSYGFTENYVRVATKNNAELPNTVHRMRLDIINTEGLVEAVFVDI